MAKTRIAIACQGGGSQTAFTAGVLRALCEAGVHQEFEIVSLSGTSGGAVCASLVWFALEKNESPWRRLMNFWQDNAAQSWAEQSINQWTIGSIRLVNKGFMPAYQLSPASPVIQAMSGFAAIGHRENFKNFQALLETHIDFAEIAAWGPCSKRPILIIGAANVLSGKLAKFNSRLMPIRVEHILASCAVPNIFPAVRIGEDAYWDGLFSDNPPIKELIQPTDIGETNLPEEIWLIKINPTRAASVPERAADIVDRRNELEGNISLFQQLRNMEMLNDMLLKDAFRPKFLAQFDIKAPVRIPKSFHTDADKPYHIPCIEMSSDFQDTLDYASKIDRSIANIDRLIAEGEKSALAFLRERSAGPAAA